MSDLIKEKVDLEDRDVSKADKLGSAASSTSATTSHSSKPKKSKKAKKRKVVASSSESSDSEFDEEPEAFVDLRFEELGTQERARIRSFKNFYIRKI